MMGTAISARLAQLVIETGQRTPFRGTGSYADLGAGGGPATLARAAFPQAEQEASRVEEFFSFFEDPGAAEVLRGRSVLDLGSGYGGRTVMYATKYGAREVLGVEVFDNVVRMSAEYAAARGVTNCRFLTVSQDDVGAAPESMDVVVSYDVLEHVEDPRVTMRGIHRVLKPGGVALLVFTPYHGMLSHHLGYITRIPGIHWVFPPEALVAAINRILTSTEHGRRLHVARQPAPAPSYDGQRRCLPTLNGLTGAEFRRMLAGFEVLELNQTPILARYRKLGVAGVALNRALMEMGDWARDAFSFNLSCILRKA